MKLFLSDLKFSQRDKLADFSINFAVAWFVASFITPFFAGYGLTTIGWYRILLGAMTGLGFVYLSLIVVRKE